MHHLAPDLGVLQRLVGNRAVVHWLQRQNRGDLDYRPPRAGGIPSTRLAMPWEVLPADGRPFVQTLDDCGAASLAALLLEQDRESGDPAHRVLRAGITSVLNAIAPGGGLHGAAARAISRRVPTWSDYLRNEVQYRLQLALIALPSNPNQATTELELALYNAFRGSASTSGSTEHEQQTMITALGRAPAPGASNRASLESYPEIFANQVVTTLRPGEAAQIMWPVHPQRGNPTSTADHAFVLGRLRNGRFFLYDQGRGIRLEASSLPELQAAADATIATSGGWLYRGRVGSAGGGAIAYLGDASYSATRVAAGR